MNKSRIVTKHPQCQFSGLKTTKKQRKSECFENRARGQIMCTFSIFTLFKFKFLGFKYLGYLKKIK